MTIEQARVIVNKLFGEDVAENKYDFDGPETEFWHSKKGYKLFAVYFPDEEYLIVKGIPDDV